MDIAHAREGLTPRVSRLNLPGGKRWRPIVDRLSWRVLPFGLMRICVSHGLPHTAVEGVTDVPSVPLGHRWGRFSLPGWVRGVSTAYSTLAAAETAPKQGVGAGRSIIWPPYHRRRALQPSGAPLGRFSLPGWLGESAQPIRPERSSQRVQERAGVTLAELESTLQISIKDAGRESARP